MKATICLLALVIVPIHAAEEIAVNPRVDSVGLFKNSVAVVRASFEVKGPGVYCWQDLPRAVHGSFWVESDGQVTIRSTTRLVEDGDPGLPSGTLQRDLAGLPVTVMLKSTAPAQDPVLSGKVWAMPEITPRKVWDNSMPTNDPWAGMRAWNVVQAGAANTLAPSTGGFLVLEPPKGGRQYVDLASIASVTVDGPVEQKKRKLEKPVMIFEVGQAPANGGRVQISYLARGIAWAPSYLIDLAGADQLSIRRNAVVRNELIDLKDTEVQLISGFPNIEFAHVDSPLWAGGSLAAFFQQLSQQPGSASGATSQQMVMYNTMTPSGGGGAALPNLAEAGGGDDVHFESIGPRSLAPGDSLSLEIASAKTACQRVVEWVVPDPRDEYGRYRRENGSNQQQKDEDAPWDALKFTNPFKLPLTTGPAMITESGRFRGQSLSQWVNPGQSTCLRVTKALSVDARYAEVEEEQQRELVWIGGNDFQKTKVKGTMVVRNFRGKEAVMSIRACFSGEMIDAEGNPAAKLRTEGVSSVNPRRELEWTLKLAPGEEKTLSYRYSVLVDR